MLKKIPECQTEAKQSTTCHKATLAMEIDNSLPFKYVIRVSKPALHHSLSL